MTDVHIRGGSGTRDAFVHRKSPRENAASVPLKPQREGPGKPNPLTP